MELDDLLDQVHDRASFLAFVKALYEDRVAEDAEERTAPSSPWGPGSHGWETGSIAQFLDAALGWAQDSLDRPGLPLPGLPEQPSWQAFARFLHQGKVYE